MFVLRKKGEPKRCDRVSRNRCRATVGHTPPLGFGWCANGPARTTHGAPVRAKWCARCAGAHHRHPKRGVSAESIVWPPDEDGTAGQGGQSRGGGLMPATGMGLIELCQIWRLPVVIFLWPLRMRLPSGLTTVKALFRDVLATNVSTSLRHLPSQFSVAARRACRALSARPAPRGPAA